MLESGGLGTYCLITFAISFVLMIAVALTWERLEREGVGEEIEEEHLANDADHGKI